MQFDGQLDPTRKIRDDMLIQPPGSMPGIYDIPEYPMTGSAGAARSMTSGGSSSSGTFQAPYWNEEKISDLTQKKALPGLRSLRQQVQRITGRRYDNPNVARMTLREALSGYGAGLDEIYSGAGKEARADYGQEYNALFEASKTGFLAKERRTETNARLRESRNQNMFNAELERRRLQYGNMYDQWRSGGIKRSSEYTTMGP